MLREIDPLDVRTKQEHTEQRREQAVERHREKRWRSTKGQVMVHILASCAFTLIAMGSLSLIVWTLLGERGRILQALGVEAPRPAAPARPATRPARVRATGWRPMASPAPFRAAA
jgi:hypothetical protein